LRITARGSWKQVTRARPWIRSNFCVKAQSSSASSTSKLQLGGTLGGGDVRVYGEAGGEWAVGLTRRAGWG
jgi:hypothetical protein